MVKRHLPSIEALTANDDELLTEELRLSVVCAELEVARAFLDQVERMVDCRAPGSGTAANDAAAQSAVRALG